MAATVAGSAVVAGFLLVSSGPGARGVDPDGEGAAREQDVPAEVQAALAGTDSPGRSRSDPGDPPVRTETRVEPRRVVVRVLFDRQSPAAGLTVVATGTGGEETSALTDEEGIAVLLVPWGDARVSVRRGGGDLSPATVPGPRSPAPARARAATTSSEGAAAPPGADVALWIPRDRVLSLRVSRRGEPSLPRPFRVRVGGREVEPTEVLPEIGFVSIAFDAPASPESPTLTFEPESGDPVTVALPPEDENRGGDVFVELEPAATPLDVRLLLPSDPVPPLGLDRWDPARGAWTHARMLGEPGPADPRGVRTVRVEGLPVGRYRAVDLDTATRSEPVDLVRSRRPIELALDLRSTGWATGRIVDDAGADVSRAELWLWEGSTADGDPRGRTGVSGDGTFRVRIPGNRPVTIGARHGTLRPAANGGHSTVVEPRGGLELRLTTGPVATLRVLRPDGTDLPDDAYLSVVLRGATGELDRSARGHAGSRRLEGVEPGVYTLFLDDGRHAPLEVPGVTLGDRPTSLGAHRLARGSWIRLRALVDPGKPIPSITAFSEPAVGGRGGRSAWVDPATGEWRLLGLAAGRHRVRFHGSRGELPPAVALEQIVEVDGEHDAEATIDFRASAVDAARGR